MINDVIINMMATDWDDWIILEYYIVASTRLTKNKPKNFSKFQSHKTCKCSITKIYVHKIQKPTTKYNHSMIQQRKLSCISQTKGRPLVKRLFFKTWNWCNKTTLTKWKPIMRPARWNKGFQKQAKRNKSELNTQRDDKSSLTTTSRSRHMETSPLHSFQLSSHAEN